MPNPAHYVYTVDVVHYALGVPDERGNQSRTETGRETYAPENGRRGAYLTQRRSSETDSGVADIWDLHLPAGAVIHAGDQVEESGRLFTVEGTPDRRRTRRGEHHVEAVLRYAGDVP